MYPEKNYLIRKIKQMRVKRRDVARPGRTYYSVRVLKKQSLYRGVVVPPITASIKLGITKHFVQLWHHINQYMTMLELLVIICIR